MAQTKESAEGLMDLEKRPGRPGRRPGSKTSSRVKRDIIWAYRNLDKPDARPPSAGAKMWAQLARTQPAHFLDCVLRVDTAGEPRAVGEAHGAGGTASDSPTRRLKTIAVRETCLFDFLSEGWPNYNNVINPPPDAHVVGCEADTSQRRIGLIISSATFPEVAEGEEIPELEREAACGR